MAEETIWTKIGKGIGWLPDDHAGPQSGVEFQEVAPDNYFTDVRREVWGSDDEPTDAELAAMLNIALPEDIEKAKFSGQSIGSNGVFDVGGYVMSTEDRSPLYNGEKRFFIFDQMVRNTGIIASGLRLYLNLLSNAEWTVNAPDAEKDNPRAKEIAEQCYDMLFDMTTPWATVVRKTAMYRFQGFSLQEWTAKMRPDGVIGILDIENRPQRTITRWITDQSGTVTSCFQRLPRGNEVELPRGKTVYAVDDALTEDPAGCGLFRHLAPLADRMNTLMQLEEIGYETDLRGVPVARAPLGELREQVESSKIDEAKRSAMLQPLKDFVNKHIRNKKTGLLLPSDTFYSIGDTQTPSTVSKWGVELMTGNPTGLADIAKAIQRMIEDMARVMGVEHLLLGSDGSGSLALAKTKMNAFFLIVTSTLGDLVEVFERDIIHPIAALNGWPDELIPSLGVGDITDDDVADLTLSLFQLAQAGAPVMPDDPCVGEIMDMMGLTRRPESAMAAAMDAALRGKTPPAPANPTSPDDPASQPVPKTGEQVAKRARRIIRSERGRRIMEPKRKAA